MKKTNVLILVGALILGVSCSSKNRVEDKKLKEVKHKKLQKDYIVVDASSDVRPGWIEDAEVWANNKDLDIEKYRYFSYETSPRVDRNIACQLAKANARADIAGEITTFIDKQLASSQEGSSAIDENNPQLAPLREYVENNLSEKTQALIHGAAVSKTYWEKRRYLAERGAKRDFTAYTCGVFIRMGDKRLSDAIERAANFVARKAADPETKATVKKALNDLPEKFRKARTGEI